LDTFYKACDLWAHPPHKKAIQPVVVNYKFDNKI